MATRYSVSLGHAGCDHTGFVVWEERGRADARGVGSPIMVGLPRGFVSLNSEDGAIEIVCAGCRQTVASAARVDPPVTAEKAADPAAAASDNAAEGGTAGEPAVDAAAATADSAAPASGAATAAPATRPPAARGAQATADQRASEVASAPAHAAAADTPDTAPANTAPANTAPADTAADAAAEDKVRADIEALFAEADDVAPIRGDAIPPHLLDKLRHLADRMRQRRE